MQQAELMPTQAKLPQSQLVEPEPGQQPRLPAALLLRLGVGMGIPVAITAFLSSVVSDTRMGWPFRKAPPPTTAQ